MSYPIVEYTGRTNLAAFRSGAGLASALAVAAALVLLPAPSACAAGDGFLSTEFIHDTVTRNEAFDDLTHFISRDSLGANILHLQSYGTRYAYSPQVVKAGRWIMTRLAGFGYTDTLYQSVIVGDGKVQIAQANVTATKRGATRPEYRIIIGSHYDSITYNQPVPPSVSAPGADDNASGTSAVLEIARVLRDVELDATVQFVSFTGHEVGMLGSYEFAAALAEEGVSPEKLFFLNLDMIGNAEGRGPWRVKIHDDVPSRPLAWLASRIGVAYTPLEPLMVGVRTADQTNFHDRGYRAIFLHEGDFNLPNYHSITDLFENLEMEYLEQVVEMAMAIVLHLATLAEPPGGLTASETGNGEVLVEWSHSLDADVVGYHVEVLDGAGEIVQKVFTRGDSALVDASALDPDARVRVRSEDVLGEGEASAAVLVGTGERLTVCATPNPSAGPCRFDVFVPGTGAPVHGIVKMVDAAGRFIAAVHDAPLERGSNLLRWSGLLPDGRPAPNGIYFYMVETDAVGSARGRIMLAR